MISSPSAIFFQARNRHRAAAVAADVVAADVVAADVVAADVAAAAAVEVQQIFNHFKSMCTFNKLLFDGNFSKLSDRQMRNRRFVMQS